MGDTFKCIECGEVKDDSELEPGFSETCSECANKPDDDLPAGQVKEVPGG